MNWKHESILYEFYTFSKFVLVKWLTTLNGFINDLLSDTALLDVWDSDKNQYFPRFNVRRMQLLGCACLNNHLLAPSEAGDTAGLWRRGRGGPPVGQPH